MTTFAKRPAPTLAERINYANTQLKQAREDGHANLIIHWIKRRDTLLEQWPRTKEPA